MALANTKSHALGEDGSDISSASSTLALTESKRTSTHMFTVSYTEVPVVPACVALHEDGAVVNLAAIILILRESSAIHVFS